MGVHGSRETPERLALRGELVEAMPQRVFMGVTRHLSGQRCKGSSWWPCPGTIGIYGLLVDGGAVR